MQSPLENEEAALQLDQLAEEILEAVGCLTPPIDAFDVAAKIGLKVAVDTRQTARARFARLATPHGIGRGSILVRPEPRAERLQWAVAHEIGESVAARAFARLDLDPRAESPSLREAIANQLAGRLLVPSFCFADDMVEFGADLLMLKHRYATASHELIARRMLDLPLPSALTIFDNGRVTLRAANTGRRRPPLAPVEIECRELVLASQCVERLDAPPLHAVCWPVYEQHWQREILRTTWDADVDA